MFLFLITQTKIIKKVIIIEIISTHNTSINNMLTASLGGSGAQAAWFAPQVGGRPALMLLYSSNEPGELWQ